MNGTSNKMAAISARAFEKQTFDWPEVTEIFPALHELDNCPQDPLHHAEGDVGTHTRMVVNELIRADDWRTLSENARHRLFWAAVLHDCGKPSTTIHEPDGRITSARHSRVGSGIARSLLRAAHFDILDREAICALITAHQLPYWLYEREDASKVACRTSMMLNRNELLIHARADARGRICADRHDLLDRIELSGTVFEDLGIDDGPFTFANDESRYAYFEREDRSPFYEAFEDFRCEATLVCGLPGTGKDTLIGKHMPDLPCVSLDRIRGELGIDPTDNQGRVIQAALEEARVNLRAGRDFVWNAVNVTRTNREKVTRLLRDYGARIRIVYLEAFPGTVLKQNSDRKATVPVSTIERLAAKMEPPTATEGHHVEWHFEGMPVWKFGSDNLPTKTAAPA